MYVGVDLVKIDRWERILEKFPARAEKIFTAEEIAHCEKKGKKRAESYAALWGAREAAGKALGIGIFGSAWQDAFVTWTYGERRCFICRALSRKGRSTLASRICPFPFPMKNIWPLQWL